VPQREDECLPLAYWVRLVGGGYGLMVAADAARDGPALRQVVLDDLVDRVVVLRMIGVGFAELVRQAVGLEDELAEDEVAPGGTPGPLFRQAGVRQGFEANRGDGAGLGSAAVDGVGFEIARLTAGED